MQPVTLGDAIQQYGADAYLLTVGKDGPHTAFVSIQVRDGAISFDIGKSAARNIAVEPNVSLFWPPIEYGGYAMIVNGTAAMLHETSESIRAEITPTKSVLHRRGEKLIDSDGPCDSDCRPLAR